jgi:hypothetical protein
MGFRFRKSIKLLPGVRLNIGKNGLSASVGVKGASVNVGKRGIRGTVGVPGTGISYTENLTPADRTQPGPAPHAQSNAAPSSGYKGFPFSGFIALIVLGALIFSCASN